jgi:hypothetical protein
VNYDELRSVLAVRDDLERGSGAAPEDVLRAAGLLGELPEDYRRFLVEFGWIAVGSFEIFGLGDDVPDYLNVVTVTFVNERKPACQTS